ncbi:MAG: glycosyltransferase family 2 protein [Clostridia bacterium]|nr:glycosyltransferase family 2 protein [Clostridia bacterium]
MPHISIVIPVYNSQENLKTCLDSILKQSFADFEVIMIDDGSKDYSGKICDKYSKIDERFFAYHFENSGVATARNRGMFLAKGDWITFIDSDDWIDPNYLNSMVNLLKKNPNSKCAINTKVSVNDNDYYMEWKFDSDKRTLCDDDVRLLISNKMPTSMWCYMFKKECLDGILVDPDIHFFEDVDFLLRIFQRGYECVLNAEGGYHYRQGSYTHTKLTWKTVTAFTMVDKQASRGMCAELCDYLEEKMILNVATVGAVDGDYDKEINKVLKKRARDYIRKKSNRKKNIRNEIIIRIIAFSPKLYYFLSRVKNRDKK